MKTTISLIKADIGSIGGHLKPSQKVIDRVKQHVDRSELLSDYKIYNTGDDVAILMAHQHGENNDKIHKLAWDAFMEGAKVAKEQGLYGAGQDLLSNSFSGNVKGAGPGVAEIEFEERPNEPFIAFMADKTDPGAFNLPLYLAFADPMHNAGLLIAPKMKGFKFTIIDVEHKGKDKVIELETPQDIYDIATLLHDLEKYAIESIHHKVTGEQSVSVSTSRLHNIAGKYVGKDDPVAIVRLQKDFPSTGEVLSPFRLVPYVAGFMRGSHIGPLMPVKLGSTVSFFDGPPIVTGAALCVRNGKFTEEVDVFDHPFWDNVRRKAADKAEDIRDQGFFGAAMLPMTELTYGGITENLEKLEKRFKLRD